MKGKNISISEMSGSGGSSFYYEIDENKHIDLTSFHPSSGLENKDVNSYWGYFGYKVTDLVLSEDKQQSGRVAVGRCQRIRRSSE